MRRNPSRSHTPATVTVYVRSASRPAQHNKLLMKRYKEETPNSTAGKRPRGLCLVIQRQEMTAFFQLFDDDLIQDFLWMDCCCIIADKYLLAMTFVYFKRAGFSINEYTRAHFFIALYLANTVEEDHEEAKYEIFPWALGKNWARLFPDFLRARDKLWSRIQHRASVSRRCCDEVMAIAPAHFIWQRERSEQHSGAVRNYNPDECNLPRGPSATPPDCFVCGKKGRLVALGLSGSSSSSSPDTSPMRRKVPKPTADPQPSSCHYFQVNQENVTGGRPQDKSMAWFSHSE
ncbi:speedy protein A [Rana temporaria]|uniref:speedy protein A n=1 Tax=Rana temporaria TaxID=8407 RepID=UPI001AAC77D8|nr:speedy protein A [Rana temporaria]